MSAIAISARKNFILSSAKNILSDEVALRSHLLKSKVCPFGVNCDRKNCGDAHFLEEYRIPICLYLEFCQKSDCTMYHPHMGSPPEYISFMGINRKLMPRVEWEMKKCIHNGAKEMLSNKESRDRHFYRTQACKDGLKCLHKETCQDAHFSDEYRIPVCPFLNFCDITGCQNFHGERETKEQFMKRAPQFKFSKETFRKHEKNMDLLRPLKERNPLAVSNQPYKLKTKLCAFVKDKKMCNKVGCSFAHSLEELQIGREFGSLKEKKEFVERRMGKQISEVYLRPAYHNSVDRKMEQEEFEFVLKMQQEEIIDDGKYVEEDEDDDEEEEEEEYTELRVVIDMDRAKEEMEILEEIEKEQKMIEDDHNIDDHKDQFIEEIEMMEMEEFDENIVVETFYY